MQKVYLLLLFLLYFLSFVSCLFPGPAGAGFGAREEEAERKARRKSETRSYRSGKIEQEAVGDKRSFHPPSEPDDEGEAEEGEDPHAGLRVCKMVRRETPGTQEEKVEESKVILKDGSSVTHHEITEDDLMFSTIVSDGTAITAELLALPTSIVKQFILNVVIPFQGNAIKMEPLFEERYTIRKTILKSIYGFVYLAESLTNKVPVVVKLSNWFQLARNMQINEKELDETDKDKVNKWKQMKLVNPSLITQLDNPFTALQIQMLIPPHKNIAQVYEVSYTHSDHVIVMEYCSGGDLFDFVTKLRKDGYNVSKKFLKLFFRQIAEAVLHMHRHGVVHLDISLENILLQPVDSNSKYELKLIDFGHARKIKYDGMGIEVLISDYTVPSGKLGYRSPECSKLLPHLGTLSDVFSLGYVLFGMASAFQPFTDSLSDSYEDLIRVHPRELIGSSESWKLIGSSELQDLLFQMFQPEERRISLTQVLNHPWLSSIS